jgi:hypothetical protein
MSQSRLPVIEANRRRSILRAILSPKLRRSPMSSRRKSADTGETQQVSKEPGVGRSWLGLFVHPMLGADHGLDPIRPTLIPGHGPIVCAGTAVRPMGPVGGGETVVHVRL